MTEWTPYMEAIVIQFPLVELRLEKLAFVAKINSVEKRKTGIFWKLNQNQIFIRKRLNQLLSPNKKALSR